MHWEHDSAKRQHFLYSDRRDREGRKILLAIAHRDASGNWYAQVLGERGRNRWFLERDEMLVKAWARDNVEDQGTYSQE